MAPVGGDDGTGTVLAGAAQGFQDALGPVRADVRGDQARAAGSGEPAQQPGLAAGARAHVQPEPVLAGQADPGQGERGQLAGLVLDGRLAAGDQGRRVAAGQPETVGRPAGPLAVRGEAGTVRRSGGAEREDHVGPDVAGGEGVLGLGGAGLAERVADRVDDPARIAVPDGEVPGRVAGPVWGDDLDPGIQVTGGHAAQDRVDEARRAGAADVLGQVDRGRHGGVAADPGGQQLMRADPEHVAHRRVELVPVAARGQDGVVGAAAAQRAVGQFGGEGSVPAGQPALLEQGGQQQVSVGVPVRDRAQDVVGGAPGRIGAWPTGAGLADTRLAGVRLAGVRLAGVRLAASGLPAAGLARAGVAGSGRPRVFPLLRHVSRTTRGPPERRPRAHSDADMRRLPGAWTSPRRTGPEPVPTNTAWRPTCSSPGARSGGAARSWAASGVTGPARDRGPSLRRAPSSSVQAPGSGVHARICRSTTCAGSFQSTLASAGVIFGAKLTPSAGCGTASSVPASIPSSVATSSSAPECDSRSSSVPVVSSSRTGSVSTPYTGPASSSLTIRNVVAPVTSSPCRMACWTGAAPRQAGRMEKCRLTQPWRGMSRADCGSRAPYAATGQQSGAILRSWSRKAGSRTLGGVSTSTPASRARRATGLGSTFRPRPVGASGRVRTAATSWRERSRASSTGTAVWGVPAKTSRIS